MFFVIVNRGRANAVLHRAQEYGATEGTIFLAEGTVQSRVLETIGLTNIEKEILMIPASRGLCEQLHEKLSEELLFHKRNSGIAFTIPFKRRQPQSGGEEENSSAAQVDPPYFCIIIIVDKGRDRACMKAARAAGARGGTLIRGRGAGIPTDFYFPLVIEPQKDILLIISTREKVPHIRGKILSDLELEKTGSGIIFTLPVSRVSGLFEDRSGKGKEVT